MVPVWFPEGPSTDLQLKTKPTLTAIISLQAIIACCRIVVGDIWGGFSDATVAIVGGFATSDSSMTNLIYYGLGCALNCIFDVVALGLRLARLGTDFFDLSRPFLFNLASFTILAAAVTAFLGAALSLGIWMDYRECADESMPLYGHQAASGFVPPPRPFNTPGAYYGTGTQFSSSGSMDAFSGPGFRLHDGKLNTVESLPPPPLLARDS